jgi:hypothetical protein
MNSDPATPPTSAGLLDRLADVAEGVKRDLVDNPRSNIVEVLVGALILIVVLRLAEYYIRWKEGVLPVRGTNAAPRARPNPIARPATDPVTPPALPLPPSADARDPAPGHFTPERPTLERPTLERPTLERPTLERPTLERIGGSPPGAGHPRAEPEPGDGAAVATAVPVPPLATTVPERPAGRPIPPVPRSAPPPARPAAGFHRQLGPPPPGRNFLRASARGASVCP